MYNWEDISLDDWPWDEVDDEDWERETNRSIIDITITNMAEMRTLLASLHFDNRRQKSYAGFALIRNVDLIAGRLSKGDRLETNQNLLDVHAVDEVTEVPIQLRFWRTSVQSRLNRECLLRRIPGYGFNILCHCGLHVLDLGVVSRYVAYSLWVMLLTDPWSLPSQQWEELVEMGLTRVRSELWSYYAKARVEDPSSNVSEIHDLTSGMVGSREAPLMKKCGGAEIRGLLPFVVFLLEKHYPTCGTRQWELLIRAGKALVCYFEIARANGRNMPRPEIQRMFDSAVAHNKFYQQAGGDMMPKHHTFPHLVRQTLKVGNPRFRTTYRNESLNGTVAVLSRSVHRAVFVYAILQKFRLLKIYAPSRVCKDCMTISLL